MGNKTTIRARFQRISKEQWEKNLQRMQSQLADFATEYAEGSDSNQQQSLEMVIIAQMIEETIKAIRLLRSQI